MLNYHSHYTVSQNNDTGEHTITSMHINRFLVIFGRDVAEKVCYQKV